MKIYSQNLILTCIASESRFLEFLVQRIIVTVGWDFFANFEWIWLSKKDNFKLPFLGRNVATQKFKILPGLRKAQKFDRSFINTAKLFNSSVRSEAICRESFWVLIFYFLLDFRFRPLIPVSTCNGKRLWTRTTIPSMPWRVSLLWGELRTFSLAFHLTPRSMFFGPVGSTPPRSCALLSAFHEHASISESSFATQRGASKVSADFPKSLPTMRISLVFWKCHSATFPQHESHRWTRSRCNW